MTDASAHHLSIGEVLGILLEEFPDITISKIRFLESQGLINPERTPSGYRKFYDDDVELLRVILREQRENFLPLRVIKDRISSGQITPSKGMPRPVMGADHSNDPTRPINRGLVATTGADRHGPPTGSLEPTGSMPRPEHVPAADPAERANHPTMRGGVPGPDEVPTDSDVAAHPAAGGAGRRSAPASGSSTRPTPRPAAAADAPSAPPAPGPAESAVTAALDPGAALAPDSTGAPANTRVLPGVVVNRDELCSMAKISLSEMNQLVEYGVVRARPNGPADVFTDDAVHIAAAASALLRAGLDIRSLRAWRTSAEREAGLFEQVVMPTLRQRSPQARAAAAQQLDSLVAASAKLRDAMMRAELSHLRT